MYLESDQVIFSPSDLTQDETKSTRSLLINAAYHQNVYHRLFGIDEPAHTDLINASLYFPLLDESVTRIYFTNG